MPNKSTIVLRLESLQSPMTNVLNSGKISEHLFPDRSAICEIIAEMTYQSSDSASFKKLCDSLFINIGCVRQGEYFLDYQKEESDNPDMGAGKFTPYMMGAIFTVFIQAEDDALLEKLANELATALCPPNLEKYHFHPVTKVYQGMKEYPNMFAKIASFPELGKSALELSMNSYQPLVPCPAKSL